VNLLKRYWPAGLILVIVVIHAAIIGYVRTRVAKLAKAHSDTVEVGVFRFQHIADLSKVYQFRLHAVVDPARRFETQELLTKKRYEVQEASELLLRQADVEWLTDPTQTDIRDRLLDIITQQLHEPMVKRVLITDWLELPAGTVFASTLARAKTSSP
jgi:flagellar basal body-associated protein FliL